MPDRSYIGQDGIDSRGLLNNNPGNMKTGIDWKGAIGDDGTFITFSSIYWGLRALAQDLTTKITKDGLTTITDIISAYAPPAENNTPAYIAAVSADSGIGPMDQLAADPQTLHDLARSIIDHELGDPWAGYIQDDDIDQGIAMRGNGLSTLVQAAAAAVSNNTDNSAIIAIGVGVGLVIGIRALLKHRRKR